MLELYQTEWCRGSQLVRQRLTELGRDFIARQVPERQEDRKELERRTGQRTVPALVLENGTVIVGSEQILSHLDLLLEPHDAPEHRKRAARSLERRCAELESGAEGKAETGLGSPPCASTPTSPGPASPRVGAPAS